MTSTLPVLKIVSFTLGDTHRGPTGQVVVEIGEGGKTRHVSVQVPSISDTRKSEPRRRVR